MPGTIENYVPQIVAKRRKRRALAAWGAAFSVALIWILLIVAAPFASANGFAAFSASIYKFFSYLCHQMSERSFHFHEFPFAVCARCFGFYGAFLAGLGIYPFFRAVEELEPLPRVWLFLAAIPMAVDWSLGFFGIWENTHFSRALTGGILGLTCAFFIVPALAELTDFFLHRKLKRLSARQP